MSFANTTGAFSLKYVNLNRPLHFVGDADNVAQKTAYLGTGGVPTLEEVLTAGNDATTEIVCEDLHVNGNMTVNGALQDGDGSEFIKAPYLTLGQVKMEFHYDLVNDSDSPTIEKAINLTNTGSTDYIVIPSIYYNYTGGSGGVYTLAEAQGALSNPIFITSITSNSFTYRMNKTTGDIWKGYILFQVIFGVSGSDYPKSYT